MTSRADIIGDSEIYTASGAIKDRGLIYTTHCGWIDLGHANPKGKGFQGAKNLWDQIKNGTMVDQCAADPTPVTVVYEQSMARYGVRSGVTRKYAVDRELASVDEQKSIALAIFLDVSIAFEALQSNWFFKHVTNSGYSVEDLVSNLISFYRAVHPSIDYVAKCQPVSREQALAVWDTFGAVGDRKNYSTNPVLFPNPLMECGLPKEGKLPPELDTIRPAVIGKKFRLL